MADYSSANIEDMHTYREWNSVITDCTLKSTDTQEHFVDCFEACSVTASFDEFYAFARVVKWTICIWDENKCVQMFKEGPRDSIIYHFVCLFFHWAFYITPTLYDAIQL